jgi:Flp pilus assembly protein TadG
VSDARPVRDPRRWIACSEKALSDVGQAAVELALCLPVVVVLVLGVLQVGLVARDQLAVELAAREAARAAAVSAEPAGAANAAAERLIALRPLEVTTIVGPTTVTVRVSARSATDVPVIGAFVDDVDLRASVTMALEPP